MHAPTNRTARRRRPSPEALEARLVLAAFAPLASALDGAEGSLRAAVIAANANNEDDVITLAAGTYTLSLANMGQENKAATGDLDLTEAGRSITIRGAGAAATIIDGAGLDRVFQVLGNVTAVFRDLTIRNGNATDSGAPGIPLAPADSQGGGILNQGSTTLDGVILEKNTASGARGLDGQPGKDGTSGRAGLGGGIASTGVLSVSRSIIRRNAAIGGRGGAAGRTAFPTAAGLGGDAFGGGIWAGGGSSSVTITQSTLHDNTALGGGGGAGADRPVSSGLTGGNGGVARGGGVFLGSGSNVATSSTVSDNTAVGGPGGRGGDGGTARRTCRP